MKTIIYVSLFDRMIKCASNKILSSINTETQYNQKILLYI